MKRIISILLVLLMCLFLFTGCGKKQEEPPVVEPDVNTEGITDVEKEPAIVNPLTGEEIEKDISANRPYCVMINNHPDARPSAGLSKAAMVYEAVVEGGITRIMGVFNDINGITLGSLRSCRPYYLSIAQAYDAVYVHAGGSEQGYSDIKSLGIDNIDGVRGYRDGEATSYYRDSYRKATGVNIEHTLFADGAKLAEFARNNYTLTHASGFDTSYGLSFSEDAAGQCTKSASKFEVYFSGWYSTVLQYDSAKGCYHMYIDDVEYTDEVETDNKEDNCSIDFANVIVLNIPTKTIDGYGRQQMEVTGSGTGYFCCGGKYIEIKWERADRADQFHYFLTNGTPLNLAVGKTYVAVADLDNTKGIIWAA